MTVPRMLLGLVLTVIALGPVGTAAFAWRDRLLGWVGVPARVVEVILACSTVVVVSELLGVVGLYRVVPMIMALAATGAGGYWWAKRPASTPVGRTDEPTDEDPPSEDAATDDEPRDEGSTDDGPGEPVPSTQMGRWGAVLTVVALSLLLADWAPWIVDAYHHGMLTVDTIWYHLPMATRWVQTGSLAHVQYFDNDAITAFYPANSELFHGLGLLLLGGDLLSPLIDLAWLGLALASAWSIGRRYRIAPLTVTGAAVVFATPGMIGTQPGGALQRRGHPGAAAGHLRHPDRGPSARGPQPGRLRDRRVGCRPGPGHEVHHARPRRRADRGRGGDRATRPAPAPIRSVVRRPDRHRALLVLPQHRGGGQPAAVDRG